MDISETDGEVGGTLEFDFLFDEVDLLANQEATEIPSNHQNETTANISTDKGDELGASGESNEAQVNPHEVDTILNAGQVVELQKHGATCEISSGTTSFVNALNLAQQGLLIPAPPPPPPTPQPYAPSAENQEVMAYPSSYNQSGSPTCTQLVPMTTHNANAWETSRPSSTQFSWTTIPQPPFYPAPAPAPTMGHDGVLVQTPFQTIDQREANQLQMINHPVPYQQQQPPNNINIAAYNPDDQNINVPHQFENLPLSHISTGPMSQLGTNNQLVQSITNNNFIPYNQQQQQPPALYPPNSFPPQNLITGPVGVPNQIRSDPLMNQQPIFAPQVLVHPAAYRPSTTQLGYYWPQQPNQVMATNVTDPQFMPLPPQQATSLRGAQQLPNQAQRVQRMAPNFYDPNCVYTMQPGFGMPPLRTQTIPYQYQQLNPAPVAPPNGYDPLVYNTMLQPAEISTSAWPPQFAYPNYQQPNDQMRPTVQDSFLPAGSSMPSRIQPLNDAQVLNQGQMMTNVVVPQLSNTMPPADHHQQPLLKSSGLQQEQFNQVPRTSTVCNPLQNSFTVTEPRTLSRPSDQLVPQMEATQMMMPNVTDCSSILSTPSIISKPQEASDQHQQQVNIGTPMMGSDDDDHTAQDPQLDNSPVDHPALQSPSVHSRQNIVELREILNNRRTNTKPTAAVPSYQTYVINSLTERERRDQNTTGLTIPTQDKPSPSKLKEQRTLERVERRGRKAGKRKEVVGDSSVPSKRSKKEAAGRQEKRSTASKSSAGDQEITVVTSQSEENEVDNSSVSDPLVTLRRVRNACYDPRFEAMGLPIDPHIRMFTRR